jgi:DNA ligase-associated metallophosphoesterase
VNELPLTLADEDALATTARALVWKDTVFVADVHFGKDALLRSAHHWAPPGGTTEDLARLTTLLEKYSARRLVILGDLFHSAHATEAASGIREWRDQHPDCEILAIPGNHDRHAGQLASTCGFRVEPEGSRLGPWVLRHHPNAESPEPAGFTLCGHIHPVAILRGPGRQRLRVPCFALSEHQGILPAFGSFTGGHPVRPQPMDRIIAIAEDQLVDLIA